MPLISTDSRRPRTGRRLLAEAAIVASDQHRDGATIDEHVYQSSRARGIYSHMPLKEELAKAATDGVQAEIGGLLDKANATILQPERRLTRAPWVGIRFVLTSRERRRLWLNLISRATRSKKQGAGGKAPPDTLVPILNLPEWSVL
jgi:hypothetical protein